MSYLIKALIILCAFVAQAALAQQAPSAFAYSEIILGEEAVESPRVIVVYSKASGVVEVRFQECEDCQFRTLPPEDSIKFVAGEEELPVEVAVEQYRNSPGTVFFDRSDLKVNRINYFGIRDGGGNK
ncbi:hypothetical protein [Marinobacter sediminicola]|uniref:hypothetical protein n=1 Tax=Marinobacter sediminicola TaxID=3072994 RepID=UPI0028123112|nr:hypothetical protein [Marinobacter sp. F26243]